MVDLTEWSLDRLTTKIQRDLELHAEVFIQPEDIQSFINDAIDDAEELIVDCFSDFFLSFKDYTAEAGQEFFEFPDDIYEMRIRGLYYDRNSFAQAGSVSGSWYKLKKIPLEQMAAVDQNDSYRYRLINSQAGKQISIFPAIRTDSEGRFKLWYIRKAKRLAEASDVLEAGLRPQFIISHAKVSILAKERSDMVGLEAEKLSGQREKLLDSLSRVSDDAEDSYLEPDFKALDDAYGDGPIGYYGV